MLNEKLEIITKKLEEGGVLVERCSRWKNEIMFDIELYSGWVISFCIDENNLGQSLYKEAMSLDILDKGLTLYNDDISYRKLEVSEVVREWKNLKDLLLNISLEILELEGYFADYTLNENLKIKIIKELGDFFYMHNGIFEGELDYTVNSIEHINDRLVEFYNKNIIEVKNKDKKEVNKKIINSLENILNNKY